jgi:hypothetical protein
VVVIPATYRTPAIENYVITDFDCAVVPDNPEAEIPEFSSLTDNNCIVITINPNACMFERATAFKRIVISKEQEFTILDIIFTRVDAIGLAFRTDAVE